MRGRVLLTVSGTIDDKRNAEIAAGRRPRADYAELRAAVDGELVDFAAARRRYRFVARWLGKDVALAWACRRRHGDVDAVFTDSERVGMIYAVLCTIARQRPRHVMIAHRLSAQKKLRLHRLLRMQRRIDHVVVYSGAQRDVVVGLGYPAERVTLMPFMVDTRFWRNDQQPTAVRPRPLICAVGQELRDYPTFVAAVDGLDADVMIAASSPWSKRSDSSAGLPLPPNVSVGALDPFGLRRLYAEASIVVVPVLDTDFQAGITTILEGMSMALPVICTRTRGQTDTVVEGLTGRYVPPGDPVALRSVIEALLADSEQCRRLGLAGRGWVADHADIESYVSSLAMILRQEPAPPAQSTGAANDR